MAAFTRKHYITIARILSDLSSTAIDHGDLFLQASTSDFVDRLAESFRRDNPRFDTDRFLAAAKCLPPPSPSAARPSVRPRTRSLNRVANPERQ